jgi:predicted nucleotidyltransferase
MVPLIETNLDGIRKLCETHYVEKLYLIGSAARGDDFSEQSDVDFLAHYKPIHDEAELFARGDFWWELEEGLRHLLGRQVDVLSAAAIKNKYLIQSINQDKTLLYAA